MTTCTLSLPPNLLSQLDKLAQQEDRSRSNMVAVILRKELETRQEADDNTTIEE